MKKLAIILALPLLLSACGAEALCNRIGFIPVAPAPTDVPETAQNKFDTDATVRRVELHNRVVTGACGILPVRQQ
jgi:hypothetical protein